MNSPRVVIVGAGAGGDATAIGLRKQGFEGEVILVGDEVERPYERPYLSKQFLRGETTMDRVFLRPEGDYERQNIRLMGGVRVTGADRDRRELVLGDGRRLGFDVLVLATGSTPRWLPDVPHLTNVVALRSLAGGIALKHQIEGSGRILLLGTGFIGAEVAASARVMGKAVLAVEAASVPLERALGSEIGAIYARIHRSRGVDLRLGTTVTEWITKTDRLTAVRLSDGSREDVDLGVIAVGVAPNTELGTQLRLDASPQEIVVDERLRAAEDIYAIGDICAHLHPVYGRRMRVEHWQVAQRQGTAVAAGIAGEDAPYAELPWFWSDQYDINLQYVGNTAGFDQAIMRGDPEGEKFSVFYLKNGAIDAVLSVNDGRSGRFSRELITRRSVVPQDALADPEVDLRELAKRLT